MNKESVLHIYNGILLSHLKEWHNAIAATWMDLDIVTPSELIQTETEKYYMTSNLFGI